MSDAPQRPRPTIGPDRERIEREKRATMEFRVDVMWTIMSMIAYLIAGGIILWFGVLIGQSMGL